MPSPTSATLFGPTAGECAINSSAFSVTLDQPADVGGVVVTVTSSVAGDTVGTFTVRPSSGGTRNISISTTPTLTVVDSPWAYMSQSPRVGLSGPASGDCSVVSTNFTVGFFRAACVGGVTITVTSSEASDTITPSSFTVAAGGFSGSFTVTPNTCGNRTITIATNPPATLITGSPRTYGSNCACPDDAGSVSRSLTWTCLAVSPARGRRRFPDTRGLAVQGHSYGDGRTRA
jgi:hypothetical protein